MFIIQLTQMQGVELILKALRQTGCIASRDLADGIESNLIFLDTQTGEVTCCVPAGVTVPVRPKLTVIPGSGTRQ